MKSSTYAGNVWQQRASSAAEDAENALTTSGLCLELRPGSHPTRVLEACPTLGHAHMEEIEMKVRPLHDRILVRRVAEEEKTKGGIIIPDTAKEKPSEGEVVAVGSGKVHENGAAARRST